MAKGKREYKIKGHESFALRDGWIYKGMSAVKNDNKIFMNTVKASDELGVGTNMVKSIRYWLKASNIITETQKGGAVLTNMGEIIYEYDPYIEDIFTLILIHINIATNEKLATSWYLFFNKIDSSEFTKDDLYVNMKKEMISHIESDDFSEKSLKDDCNLILNMYSRVRDDKSDPEDKNISPLAELGLIKSTKNKYKRCSIDCKYIDEIIILYMLNNILNSSMSVSIEEALNGNKGISKILSMGRNEVSLYFDKLSRKGYITLTQTAGLDIIYKNMDINNEDIITAYYKKR